MNLVPVPFHDDTLWAGQDGEVVRVAVKAICDSLSIDWESQRQRIRRDAILNEGACIIQVPSPGGMQETVCLPLPLLPGFLFGIDDRRVKDPAAREKVLAYKRECYEVLFRHFFAPAAAPEPEPAPTIPPMLSPWEAFRRGDPAGITWFNSIMAGAPFIQRTGGRAGLIAYMREMGIPLYGQPANPVGHISGGSECLTFLFAGALPDGRTVRDALAATREGDRETAGVLVGCGLMVTADFGGGLWVANSHPFLTEVFAGTPWAGRKWRDALRLLPGSTSPYTHNRHRFGRQQARATFVPWGACPF